MEPISQQDAEDIIEALLKASETPRTPGALPDERTLHLINVINQHAEVTGG